MLTGTIWHLYQVVLKVMEVGPLFHVPSHEIGTLAGQHGPRTNRISTQMERKHAICFDFIFPEIFSS